MKKIIILFFILTLSGCATPSWVPFIGGEPEPSAEEVRESQFNEWLKQKRNYKNYATRAEAEEAFNLHMDRKRQEQEWKEYKNEKGITYSPGYDQE